jgi:hypothetical protein
MLRWLLRRTIESFERKWHYDASYLKESEAACRQLASRARTHVREARPHDESVARDRADDATTRHAALVSALSP